MNLTPGLKLRSSASSAQVIVIRGSGDADLTLAGAPASAEEAGLTPGSGQGAEPLLVGKRYSDPDDTVELLCTMPGDGPLTWGGVALTERVAKSLPSSD